MQDIVHFEGLYAVTTDGAIWSYPKAGSGGHSGKWLKPDTKPNGYQTVTLVKDGVKTRQLIHRIVAIAYLPNTENKPCVNHKNGVKTDNSTGNLEWCTWAENEQHSYDTLGKEAHKHAKGKTGYESTRGKEVQQYTLEGDLVATFGSGADAARAVSGCQSSISATCRGKRKQHKGYVWKYI